jgi:hypothetical protein
VEKSGKWLVVAIFVIAFGLGAFSWWFRWSATHRAAKFWGAEAAKTIRDSKAITAARLTNYESNLAGPTTDQIAARFDASQAKGIVHLKQALLEDRSFAWGESASLDSFSPRWMLDFAPPSASASNSHVFVFFDATFTQCCFLLEGKTVRIEACSEKFSSGLNTFLTEWFPDASD